jgi:hypothetical protein
MNKPLFAYRVNRRCAVEMSIPTWPFTDRNNQLTLPLYTLEPVRSTAINARDISNWLRLQTIHLNRLNMTFKLKLRILPLYLIKNHLISDVKNPDSSLKVYSHLHYPLPQPRVVNLPKLIHN